METPKRHHTVPKFYLSGFAAGKRLSAVNVATGVRHATNVADATVEANFYTVRDHPTDPNEFEALLSKVEGAAAATLRSVVAGEWPLPPDDRAEFASFMTLQFLRLQSHREQMHHAVAARLSGLAARNPEELDRILALPGAPPGVEIAGGDGALPSLIPAAVHIQQISALVPKLVGYLLARPWELVRFEKPSLLTSDEPLTPLANPAEQQNVGLGLKNSWALIYPLVRNIALVMFRDPLQGSADPVTQEIALGHFDCVRDGDPESSRLFNVNTTMHANRFVYHHPDDGQLVPENLMELSQRGGRINLENPPDGIVPAT